MTKLKPTLGPVQLLFYCVGVIVGAGVYSIIGPAAGLAGQGLWLLPEHPRPFRVPLYIERLSILPVIAMMPIVLLLANFDVQVYLACAAILVLICIGFLWKPSKAPRGFTGH